jgi:hypothetical protein
MAEAYIVSALRTAGGRRGGRLSSWHPADLAALGARRQRGPHRRRSGGCRRRDHGLRRPGRRAVRPCRPQCRARLQAAAVGARCDDRPPVRLLAAEHPLRRAGGDERHPGSGDRGRRRIDEPRADGAAHHPADEGGARRPVAEQRPGALRRPHVQPVHGRADDRPQIRPQPRAARPLRAAQPRTRDRRHPARRLRRRDRRRARRGSRRRVRAAPDRRGHPLRRELRQASRPSSCSTRKA